MTPKQMGLRLTLLLAVGWIGVGLAVLLWHAVFTHPVAIAGMVGLVIAAVAGVWSVLVTLLERYE